MSEPPFAPEPIDAATFRRLRLRTIFECRKWDPQVGDVDVLSPFPLVVRPDTWRTLADAAEQMTREAVNAERELLSKPGLLRELGLPRPIARMLRRVGPSSRDIQHLRAMRFDFHWTAEGWRVSECNADVPGGWNEASGFSGLVAEHYPGAAVAGDPTDALVRAMLGRAGRGARVAMLHATAYVDDRQVMQYIADRAVDQGLDPLLISPAQLDWRDGRPHHDGPIDLLLRFYPGEWLINLRPRTAWTPYFTCDTVPACNPATALLIQSKRLPVVWDRLDTAMDAWRRYLPESVDPRSVNWRQDDRWLLKPAFGRVGEGILMRGVTPGKTSRRITRDARLWPGRWVAQRRFDSVPIPTPGGPMHVCVGVYVVDGKAVGAYGRVSRKALIDAHALDAALLIAQPVRHDAPAQTPVVQGAGCA